MVAGTFIPISFGWAAGDVSLAAYIQALLQREESQHKSVSPLGAVMACLYSTYIIMYAISSPLLGKYIDRVSARNGEDISSAIQNVAGVQFTVLAGIIICATFIPRGSFALNPEQLSDQDLSYADDQSYLAQPEQDGFTEAGGDEKHAPVRI